jgi:GNAT superfamily N-acetyltransferase
MLQASLVNNPEELGQILALQSRNLSRALPTAEQTTQGFLTVQHDLHTLRIMHSLAPSVIVKDKDKVVAYALTMLTDCRDLIPELKSMFNLFTHLKWKGNPLSDYSYYVMGQVCVDKQYRGLGLFDRLYVQHRDVYRHRFDLLVTEISARNVRSLRAHARVGFQSIHQHRDHLDDWVVVGWDWNPGASKPFSGSNH